VTLLFPVLASSDDGSRSPGVGALLLMVVLGIVTVLLIRNMSGRIKRLPREFPDREAPPPTPRDGTDGPT